MPVPQGVLQVGRLRLCATNLELSRGWSPAPDDTAPAHRYGFSSTTTEREQAVHYAQGSASTVLELEMGMVDRGSDIS